MIIMSSHSNNPLARRASDALVVASLHRFPSTAHKPTAIGRLVAALACLIATAWPGHAADGDTSANRPAVQWVAPADASVFPAYSTIVLKATASSTVSTIQRVIFVQGTNRVLGIVSAAPFSFTWANVPPGTYQLRALAQDASNVGALTPTITITVSASTGSGSGTGGTPSTPPPPPPPTLYQLTVASGTGSGQYAAGTTVAVTANAAPSGQTFNNWTGVTVANSTAPTTTLVMPAASSTVTATYKYLPPQPPTGPVTPIMFVTQVPVAEDFTTIASAFGTHKPSTDSAARGGDLYIRYADGSLKNLTAAAGYGLPDGYQGGGSIAVRDPSVHFNGQQALFSMAITGSTNGGLWQIYEITGFGQGQTPTIHRVSNQPPDYNNIAPCYGTDGRVIFASDRPRNGQRHLYPQLDEYELQPTVTGLWSLDPVSGDLFMLNHTPSGVFNPSIDSFGRLIFIRWDHLQRDQEADLDQDAIALGNPIPYGTFNTTDESTSAQILRGVRTEVFPEPRANSGIVNGHRFNIFFPWAIQEDGTEEEIINHAGRHELYGYLPPSFNDDPSLGYFYNTALRFNTNYVNNFFQVKEDPKVPGRYFGVDSPEFTTHASGQIVTINAPQGLDADHIAMSYITDVSTKTPNATPPPTHSGHYREPLPLSDGTLVAVHTPNTDYEHQRGVGSSDFAFRLKSLWQVGASYVPYQNLTPGIQRTVSFYAGGKLVNFSGTMWELNPVEVRQRPIPHGAKTPLGAPEQQVFQEEGVDTAALSAYLKSKNLALVISRNVTTRDHADRQQPVNLKVAGSSTQSVTPVGFLYEIAHLQFFQGDQIRGYGLINSNSVARAGRRVLAQPLHDAAALADNVADPLGPTGSVKVASDGSVAAIIPARRAMTWQLTDTNGVPVVRERYWVTFQPGEIRTCASCHGVNTRDQLNRPAPTNKPEALRELLQQLKPQLN